ncbi:MAG: Unknown protein [uncultured Sulfurovum sp.]|uniref:Porin domain-containing protein n=1 Tax=uncultured Sulfurovum sp. TaxID=269237 RepID=A0A6S6SWL9_9BACT|nr:MAG: Unknown protein [uncultured Sulfurovum sp.]
MKNKALIIGTILSLYSTSSFSTNMDFLSVNGFGTLGGAYQDNDQVLYRDSIHTDKGSQGDFSFDNYSVLGLQLDAQATDKLSFTVQGIASPTNSNDKAVKITWANAKYKLNNNFDIRAGLMIAPNFMFSDILNVAYSYDTVRLPDMYGLVTINDYTGAELIYHNDIGEGYLSSSIFYGKTTDTLKAVIPGQGIFDIDLDAQSVSGISIKYIENDLTLKGSYIRSTMSVDSDNINNILSYLSTLNLPIITNTLGPANTRDIESDYFNLGARYDFENAYVQGEYIQFKINNFLPDLSSWNLTSGYMLGDWTPFVSYSEVESKTKFTPISTQGLPPQVAASITAANQGLSQVYRGWLTVDMQKVSVGTRYDINDNFALKFQYDKQDSKDADDLEIFSTALNFVF